MSIGYTNSNIFHDPHALRVKQYTSLPLYAREGEIAVVTDALMPKWSVTDSPPEVPANGEVAIITDTVSNPININNKNPVIVYPRKCMQFQNGAWSMVDAYIWADDKWTQFSYSKIYIIKDGIINSDDFIKSKLTVSGNTLTTSGNVVSVFYKKDKIDLSDFSTLHITVTYLKSWKSGHVPGIYAADPAPAYSSGGTVTNVISNKAFSVTSGTALTTETTISLDVSGINQTAYVGLSFSGDSSYSGKITISNFWVE